MPDTFNEGNIFPKFDLNYILEVVCFKFARVWSAVVKDMKKNPAYDGPD